MKLRVNIHQVQKQIRSIQSQIEVLQSVIKKQNAFILEVESAWKGSAADSFLAKLKDEVADLTRSLHNMVELVATLNEVLKRIKDTENTLIDAVGGSGHF